MSWFGRTTQLRWAQALYVPISRAMKSSANSGGWLDASGTTRDLSQTRQGVSTISKERRYRLTNNDSTQ